MAQTLFDKIWEAHRVSALDDGSDLLYLDRIFLHERTGGIALQSLAEAGHSVCCPEQVFCTFDHIVDTMPGRSDQTRVPNGTTFIQTTRKAAQEANLTLFDIGDERQGIVHVISPEQGIALPGCTVVCPDSHTCTLGGLGALGWGIGSSEAEHALATSTLRVRRPLVMRVEFKGEAAPDISAKDMILHLIGQYGAGGAASHAVEFSGPAIRALPVEGRLTLCNMAVEFSAFSGLVAPDEKTLAYVKGRPWAPQGEEWERAIACWSELFSDAEAHFDREIQVDAAAIQPTVTWGTSPGHAVPVDGTVPEPAAGPDAATRQDMARALEYMGLKPGQRMAELAIDAAFIGSCTNSRLSDLRSAAEVLRGHRVAKGVKAICVPGSTQVKQAAEAEGLDEVFQNAGFEWRESGCSMCFYAGGEGFAPGQRVITTTNRNFEGRQGPGARSHLASPATVAASALAGHIARA